MTKSNIKNKRILFHVIMIASAVGIAIQIIGGAIVALLIQKGSIAESSALPASIIIRMIGTVATITVAWHSAPDCSFPHAIIATAVIGILPLIAAMLLGEIEGVNTVWGIVITTVTFAVYTWMLKRMNNKRSLFYKKRQHR